MATQAASGNIPDIIDLPKAEWLKRSIAFITDLVLALVLGEIVHLITHNTGLRLFVIEIVFIVNFIVGWAHLGYSFGMWFMHLRVVTTAGGRVGWFTAIWRFISFWISVASGFGMALVIYTPQHQGLHDMLASTYVINNRKKPE
jgi:uncharacterized RDD family membrane protein YckC